VLISQAGKLFQSASFRTGTWHVGTSGRVGKRSYSNINRATIGIELENAGRLEFVNGRLYAWPYWEDPKAPAGKRYPSPKLEYRAPRPPWVKHAGRYYAGFSPKQEAAACALVTALATRFALAREDFNYGHYQFDPGRKEDPGPYWMQVVLARILDQVFSADSPTFES
jgi:N-acetyl-anhydromuramyl-L-alanine amidase AmpD